MTTLTRAEAKRLDRIRALAQDLCDVADAIRENVPAAVNAICMMQPDGLPSGNSDGRRGPDVSNPTLNAVIAGIPGSERLEQLRGDLLAIFKDAVKVNDRLIDMKRLLADKAHQPAAGSGACLVDDEWVPGMGEDRIKSGFCPRHHRAWCRWREETGGDRQAFIHWARQPEADEDVA